jgi:lipoprotein-anchoring transpeptidase ErfK/SrfK
MPPLKILIRGSEQTLHLLRGRTSVAAFPVSTSRFGFGSEGGSRKTPIGRFRICEKIGAEMPANTVFKGRQPLTEECVNWVLEHDLITSRILWLEGLDPSNANTRDRYIYIHGTNQEHLIGEPASHGCVRMRKADVIQLFDLVRTGTEVEILS